VTRPRHWLARLTGHRDRDAPASLGVLLRSLDDLDSHAARAEWFEHLGAWAAAGGGSDARARRVELLVDTLEHDTERRDALGRQLDQLLLGTHGLRLFADTGLSTEYGFAGEAMERLVRRVLPAPPEPHNLAEVLRGLLATASEAREIAQLPASLVARLVHAMTGPPDARGWSHVRREMVGALTVLASNVATIGASEEILNRLQDQSADGIPFIGLSDDVHQFIGVCTAHDTDERRAHGELKRVLETTERCRATVGQVVAHIESHGVSTHLVYRLEQLSALLDRIDLLARILVPGVANRTRLIATCVSALGQGIHRDRSVAAVVSGAMRQLSRKVVERTGAAGKHYVVQSRRGWWRMLGAAAGGGAVTVGTAAFKLAISAMSLAPFFYGAALSVNYAASFILLQIAGFKLATKQPAMFAATIADSLLDVRARADSDRFTEEVARVTRSQTATVVGNIGMVVPVAVLFDALWRWNTGHNFLDLQHAEYALKSLHPFRTGTIVFAALTGVILMASSVVGGWMENFAVYRRLPEAIAQHRVLTRVIGAAASRALATVFIQSVAGVATSVALGVLLGMTPSIGAFFGIPLDVRHVTLSMGQLVLGWSAFVWSSLGVGAIASSTAWMAMLGIAVIGLFNFGVSFGLAMLLAIRAREVPTAEAVRLLRGTWREFARRPARFLFATSDAEAGRAVAETAPLAEHVATSSLEHGARGE
jgi:site-specific recombinase